MTSRRQREWRNESGILTPALNSQVNVAIGSTVFQKGATVVRIIGEIAMTPVTVDTDAELWVAIWVGHGGGPANISTDGNDSFLYWKRVVHNLASAGAGSTERFQYRQFDIRGQRQGP